jgi:tetratricopeptide (TPR) repeat protein
LEYALRLRAAFQRVEEISDGQIADPGQLLPPLFGSEMDFVDFLFAIIVQHTRGSQEALEAFQALDRLEPDVRNRFIDAMSNLYSGPSVFVNSGWSHDQVDNENMPGSLGFYDQIAMIVAGWKRPDLEAEIACARSVILDEGLKRPDDAIVVTDEAIAKLGKLPPIVRQKSKVLGHAGRHLEATELLLSIEDKVGLESPLERALALRDGGVFAAKAERFTDAFRLFDKAYAAFILNADHAPLASSILVEKALALWRGGEKGNAIAAAADALDAVEAFPYDHSRQAERSHQYARAIVGLFFSEVPSGGDRSQAPFTFGQASWLESSLARPSGIELAPLSDNWRILAVVEAALGTDAGIDARSMAKQGASLVFTVERLLRTIRYAVALKSKGPEASLRAGVDLVNLASASKNITPDDGQMARIDATQLIFNPRSLLADEAAHYAVQSILTDVILAATLEGNAGGAFPENLRRATISVFGRDSPVNVLLQAASGLYAIGSKASRAVMLTHGIAISDLDADQDPARRFHRDMMITDHLASSIARTTLAGKAATKIARGWNFVLEHQCFLLRNPSKNAPDMKLAIARIERDGIPAVADLLLVAFDAVDHQFSDAWIDVLKSFKTVAI